MVVSGGGVYVERISSRCDDLRVATQKASEHEREAEDSGHFVPVLQLPGDCLCLCAEGHCYHPAP